MQFTAIKGAVTGAHIVTLDKCFIKLNVKNVFLLFERCTA